MIRVPRERSGVSRFFFIGQPPKKKPAFAGFLFARKVAGVKKQPASAGCFEERKRI